MALILHRVPGTKLFINVDPAQGPRWATDATFCFYQHEVSGAASLTFEATRGMRGTYALLPPNPAAPFDILQLALAGVVPVDGHLLWWMGASWQSPSHQLAFAGGRSLASLAMPLWSFAALPDEGNGSGELRLLLPMEATVDFAPDHLVLTHAGAQLGTTVDGQATGYAAIGGRFELRLEPGPRCATFTGDLASAETASLVATLTPQVRYMWRRNALASIKAARILSPNAGDHRAVAARFQLQSFGAGRDVSRIDLVAEGDAAALVSCLPDTDGHAVELRPAAGAAIYFEPFQGAGNYASLRGQFALREDGAALEAGADTTRDVMPGGAGTEFFQLGRDGFDGLEFFPGQAAFVEFAAGNAPPKLTTDRTTAWMAPCRTSASAAWATTPFGFVAQSEDEPLFGRRATDGAQLASAPSSASTVLFDPAPMPVPAGTALPFFPFPGVRSRSARDTDRLDVEALAPARSRIAAQAKRGVTRPAGFALAQQLTWITTPQGLLVEVDAANEWHRIRIGTGDRWKMDIARPTVGGQPVERWALQEALSRSEVFVVLSRRATGGLPNPGDPALGDVVLEAEIAGWRLKVDLVKTSGQGWAAEGEKEPEPAPESGFAPVLVLKLSKGPLDAMLGNVGRWALGTLLNDAPEATSRGAVKALGHLKSLADGLSPPADEGAPLKDREIAAELKPYYRDLYCKITDPAWTGILAFNAHVPLDGVPEQLRVLTDKDDEGDGEDGNAGMRSLGVPVLGLDLSRVVPEGDGQLRMEKSSAFGAIHFHAPTPLLADDKGFALKLRSLNAVFENTDLRVFLASMQLRLAQFFGANTAAGDQRLLDIVCRYEGRSAAGEEAAYTFRALGTRTMSFTGNAFLDKLTVQRIDLTSRTLDGEVESRFAMWGQLEFAQPFSRVTGIRKIEYGNSALVRRGGKYSIDAGNVKVDFKKEGDSIASGLLAKFPFQLSGMRWASQDDPLSLSAIGFAPLALPGFPDLKAPSFDFAFELDLNLGSMGKLFEAAKFLKARILVGWYRPRTASAYEGFSVGFAFDGGNGPLDIGVNGVMRLTAEAVNLQTYNDPAGIGIGLLNPQLEVMGHKIPERPRDTLVAFLPAGKDNVAWAWARNDTEVGPLKLHYFAIGQRMHLVEPGVFDSGAKLAEIVEKSQQWVRPRDSGGVAKLPDIAKLYTEEAGWGVVAAGAVSAFRFRFVFLDGLDRYGLGVDIPNIADIDVMYRKLSDGVGVFSAEITPAFRTLEMGAATVTLPIVGFDALTNGNWSINIGYHGNDFSRGTTVQLLPFLGSGGLRFGKLDWRSSYVLSSPHSANGPLIRRLKLDPVIEMSMAARLGIGKEYREGVFAAGVSLSVYGIFEGALGRPTDPAFPSSAPRRYIKLAGTAGVLLEIFGAVRFAVVSAAVSIRLWVEVGLTLESWTPVVVHAEAGVSVRVRFVVARFKVFGRRIEIAIHFSFSTRVRFTQRLPYAFDGENPYRDAALVAWQAREAALDAHGAIEPLAWELHAVGTPARVAAAVTLEPMLSGTAPVVLPMLFAGDTAGQAGLPQFTMHMFTWALRLSLGLDRVAPTPAKVSVEQLSALCSRIAPPRGTSLARWGARPLDFAALEGFFAQHLRIDLHEVAALLADQKAADEAAGFAAKETARGILLPWFADLAITAIPGGGGAPQLLRDFRSAPHARVIDAAWEMLLSQRLASAAPEYPQDEKEILKGLLAAAGFAATHSGGKQALDAVTEDWAAALVQGIAQRALLVARDLARAMRAGEGLPAEVPDEDLPEVELTRLTEALCAPAEGGSLAEQVGKHASTFLHHGLRVPPAMGDTAAIPLAEFLRTELLLSEFDAANEWTLAFAPRPGFAGAWMSGAARIDRIRTQAAASHLRDLGQHMARRKVKLTAYLEDSDPRASAQPRRFIADTLVPFGPRGASAGTLRIASVPPALAALARRRGGTLQVAPRLEVPGSGDAAKDVAARWFVKVDVQLEGGPDKARPAYSIRHVDPKARRLVREMLGEPGLQVREVRLAFRARDEAAAVPLEFLRGDEAFVFVSNLSREPAPPRNRAFSATRTPTHASLGDAEALARILWMAATVNAPGFHLAFRDGKDPIAHLFQEGAIGTVSLVFELDPATAFTAMVDGLLLDAADVGEKHVLSLTTPSVLESRTGTPQGQVAVIVERRNPLHGIPADASEDELDLRFMLARFEMMDFWTHGVASVLDRGDVTPIRPVLDEEELRAAADEGEPPVLRHRILVPLARIGGLANPCLSVGTDVGAMLRIGLRDGAGHFLPDDAIDFEWMAGRPRRLLYREALLGLQELPGVEAKWRLRPQGDDALVAIGLRWDAGKLFSAKPELAARQREALVAIFQRAADVAEAGDFRASAEVSLAGRVVAAPDVRNDLRAWLAEVLAQLAARTDQPCTREFSVRLPAAAWPAATPQPVRIDVAIAFRRDPELCDQRLLDTDSNGQVSEQEKKASDIASVRSPVLADGLQTADDWTAWAGEVRTAFRGSLSLLRRMEGDPDTPTDRAAGPAVWLMRRRMLDKTQLRARGAGFHAPAPLARTLRSGSVRIPLADGQDRLVDAQDVDLNVAAARAAGALETMLSRAVGEPLCRWRPDLYDRMALAKQGVADAMAGRLETILASGGTVPDAAAEKFRNACGAEMRAAFAPAALVSVGLPPVDAERTYLWGTVSVASQAGAGPESPFSFSPVRVPLGPDGIGGDFDFVVQWADPGSGPLALVQGALRVRPQYVEVVGAESVDGYIPSDWYEVVWSDELGGRPGIEVQPPQGATWSIPLPLRQVPPTPTILRHKAGPRDPGDASDLDAYIARARTWEYGVSVMVPAMDHDTSEVAVRFSDSVSSRWFADDRLFHVLVAYLHHAQAVDEVAGALAASGKANLDDLLLAVRLFESLVEALAARAPVAFAPADAVEEVRTVQLRTRRTTRNPLPAEIGWQVTPERFQAQVRATLLRLESIEQDDSQVPPTSSDPVRGIARYEGGADAALALGGTAGLSPRHIALADLDVMVQSRAMPTVVAYRNANLLQGGGEISDSFIFRTATVGTPDALVPRLVHGERFDMSRGAAARSTFSWLGLLRDALVREVDAGKYVFDVAARLRLALLQDDGVTIEAFTPQAALKSASASASDWVTALARHYHRAIRRLAPEARRTGALELAVHVFPTGAGHSQKPVLSLTGLYLPLAMITDEDAFAADARPASDHPLPVHQLAAYVFRKTRHLAGQPQALAAQGEALVAQAAADHDEAAAAALPSAADLASEEGRAAWVAALVAAASARRN